MASPSELVATRPLILQPYEPDPRAFDRRLRAFAVFAGVCAFCVFYGFAFALLAPRLLLPLVAPLPLLAIVAIWALPETRTAPTRTQAILMFAFFIGLVMWPNYIAFAPPGLPWITMVRLTGFPLVLTLLICISVSKSYRETMAETLKAAPLIWKMLLAFVLIQMASIVVSKDKGFSIDKFVVAQVSWTAMFFLSVYVFRKPGRVERITAVLWAMTIPVGIIGIFEWKAAHILWVGHIPSFLTIDDPSVQLTLSTHVRSADGTYRTQSTFVNSLALGEYLALTFPFVIHYAASNYKTWIRVLAVLTLPFMIFIVKITDSRLAAIGCMMSFVLYGVIWTVLRWRRDKRSIIAPAVFLATPFAGAVLVYLLFAWKHFHDLFFGDGATKASTQARQAQLALAIPKFLSHPWGYGIGEGAQTVGFQIPGRALTLDSYFITVAIEYGIQGFIIFYGLFAMGIYYAARYGLKSVQLSKEYTMLIPLAIALFNFFVIKIVFSQQDNHAIVFMYLGMIVAFGSRINAELAHAKAANQPVRR